jgi:membrane protein DedA with SNARE-associated domain
VESAGYPGLFIVMVLGNVGLPVGTEIVVPAAGALAATGHLSSWWLAALVATAGEIVGGTLLYGVGFYGGRPFVKRWGKFIKLSEKKLDQFHEFYERYGNGVVFVCRFVPVIRGISALPAGVSRMQKRYFLIYTLLGSALFCFALSWLGNTFAHHIDVITPLIHRSTLIFVVLLIAAVVAYFLVRRARTRAGQGLA